MTATAGLDRYFSSADGLRLHYRDYPAAAAGRVPVLCLPGLTRNYRDFESIALRIQPARRVLSADLRGRGLSQRDPNWGNYHPGTCVGDIARLLVDAGAPRVVILGTSLGGILAMILAASMPQVLAGVTYGLAWPDARDEDWLAFARRSYIEVDGVPRLDMDPMIGEAVRAAPSGAAPDLWPVYAALRAIPTLALRGAISDVLSEATFDRMAREKPDLERVTVPGGHPPLLYEPASVAAIDAFLARLD